MAGYNADSQSNTVARATIAERIPPQSIEIEKSVLASALIDETVLDTLMELGKEEYFYSRQNRLIFEAMLTLVKVSGTVDAILLAEQLRKMDKLETVGGETYLAELLTTVATMANINQYMEILKDKLTLRTLIHESAEISDNCFQSDAAARQVVDLAEQRIFAIADSNIKNKPHKIKELLAEAFIQLESMSKSGGITGLQTGFSKLDELTTGLHPGELIIIAARPGMGKTAFVLSLAANMGIRNNENKPVIIFSLEMPKEQLVQRMMCSEGEVDMQRLRGGKIDKKEQSKLQEAAGRLFKSRLYIDDSAGANAMEIRAKCRRIKAQEGELGCIVIDYLQLMGSVEKTNSRQEEVSLISRTLKEIAKELSVPVIALSQLSRATETRTGSSRPQLSDLRESGSIEQDADIVMFIYREAYYLKLAGNSDSEEFRAAENKAEIIIGKQRNGPTETVHLSFIGRYTRFDNLDEYHDEERATF